MIKVEWLAEDKETKPMMRAKKKAVLWMKTKELSTGRGERSYVLGEVTEPSPGKGERRLLEELEGEKITELWSRSQWAKMLISGKQ